VEWTVVTETLVEETMSEDALASEAAPEGSPEEKLTDKNNDPPSASVPATQKERLAYVVSLSRYYADRLTEASTAFWGIDHQFVLSAVTGKNLYFWKNEPFFVSQLPLGPSTPNDKLSEGPSSPNLIQLRISESLCGTTLSASLGVSHANHPDDFNLAEATALESEVLATYAKTLIKTLVEGLVDQAKAKKQAKIASPLIHLVWSVCSKKTGISGKIILSLPAYTLHWQKSLPAASPIKVPFHRYHHAQSTVRLFVGQTRVPLEDMQQLDVGDVVLLEHSNAQQLFLMDSQCQQKRPFPVQFSQHHRMCFNNLQDPPVMDTPTTTKPNDPLWDSLLIDLSAEFYPTKIPLQQLKQISEGLIVEIGDLSHNQIRLHVEGKTIAHGELVIVGDKFGVRVNAVTETDEVLETPLSVSIPAATKAITTDKPTAPRTAETPKTETNEADLSPVERRRLRRQQRMAEREARMKEGGGNAKTDDDWLNDDFDQNLGDE